MEYIIIFFRIVSIMLLLVFSTLFIMGKRPIGELPVFDFLSLIVMGAIVGADIADPTINHLPTAFAVVVLAIFQRFISILIIKNRKINKWLTFEPTIIVQNGQLIHKNMKKIKYSIEEVLMLLREKGVFNIDELEYAIIESSGNISILRKSNYDYIRKQELDVSVSDASIPLVLVLERRLIYENLKRLNISEAELQSLLKRSGYGDYSQLLLVTLNQSGNMTVSPYDVKEEIVIT